MEDLERPRNDGQAAAEVGSAKEECPLALQSGKQAGTSYHQGSLNGGDGCG